MKALFNQSEGGCESENSVITKQWRIYRYEEAGSESPRSYGSRMGMPVYPGVCINHYEECESVGLLQGNVIKDIQQKLLKSSAHV